MKKTWMALLMVLVLLALAECASMNKGETVNQDRVTVAAYEPGKTIQVVWIDDPVSAKSSDPKAKAPGPKTVSLDITPQTEVKGEIKPGVRALIRYLQYGKGEGSYFKALSIERIWE
ncbi:MAG TPA: hypothetical protein VLS90_13635 [Thermodesulfobacteriota bacterium]|nr:hypothetical protein [Thermodesulfobacteriota bacterium]